jgi:hypothetical protein
VTLLGGQNHNFMIYPNTSKTFDPGERLAIQRQARHNKMTTLLETFLVGLSFVDCFFVVPYLFCWPV